MALIIVEPAGSSCVGGGGSVVVGRSPMDPVVKAVLDVRRNGRLFVWAKTQQGQAAVYSLYVASICGSKISFKRCLRFSDLGHPSLNEDARVRFSELDALEDPLPEIRPAELAEILLSTALRKDKALPVGRHACSLISPRFCGVLAKAFIAFDFS